MPPTDDDPPATPQPEDERLRVPARAGAPDAQAALVALMARVARRDEAALRELYDLTAHKLYGLARRVVGQPEAAEDVLQDAFVVIWRQAADYQAALSPPMAWLGLVVRSRALDHLRRRRSERGHVTQALDDGAADLLAADEPGPLDTAQASEQAWALHQCLSRLENRQREVLSLAYLRDLSHGDLATQLQLPLGTVKTWIRRGLAQLRVCMAQHA